MSTFHNSWLAGTPTAALHGDPISASLINNGSDNPSSCVVQNIFGDNSHTSACVKQNDSVRIKNAKTASLDK